jgi:hypothetical protein
MTGSLTSGTSASHISLRSSGFRILQYSPSICLKRKAENFSKKIWTGRNSLNTFRKFRFGCTQAEPTIPALGFARHRLDRSKVRVRFEERFSAHRMAREYEAAIENSPPPGPAIQSPAIQNALFEMAPRTTTTICGMRNEQDRYRQAGLRVVPAGCPRLRRKRPSKWRRPLRGIRSMSLTSLAPPFRRSRVIFLL